MEKPILLRFKILNTDLNTDWKIILLGHQNNFVGILKIISNCKKYIYFSNSFVVSIIILIVQQIYISDLYPAKILDLSAKLFFPCNFRNEIFSFNLQKTM